MFKEINRLCAPHKKLWSKVLMVVGALLLLIFIPLQVWMVIAGIIVLAVGFLYAKR